ncbi:hypothetical protein KF840_05430 [bacterium]|nr:hypothetical protein [bacterium]
MAGASGAAGDDAARLAMPVAEASRALWRAGRPDRFDQIGRDATGMPGAEGPPRRAGIDLSPAVDAIVGFVNQHGIPLRQRRGEPTGELVGVQAAFGVGRDLPAVSVNLGDRSLEPLGAFYSAQRGFRCAVVWPIDRFTLRLEGGEDSEFGYYGIAGVQWLHPRLPLALGVGVPMNLRDAEGDLGVIVQFRMRLD